jgi:Protein of unknown function (DUF3800)
MREIRHLREQTGFSQELKFSGINQGSLAAYYGLISLLETSDARMIATVTHRTAGHGSADWSFYCEVATRLVRGNVNRGEHICVLMDMMSTPRGTAFEDVVRGRVNKLLRSTQVTSAVCLDSRSSDGLQVADLVAGGLSRIRETTSRGRERGHQLA